MVLQNTVGSDDAVSIPHTFQELYFRIPVVWSHVLNTLIEAHWTSLRSFFSGSVFSEKNPVSML